MTVVSRGYLEGRSKAASWGWLIVVLLHLLGLGLLRELQRSELAPRQAKIAAQSETRGWLVAMPLLKPKPKQLPKPKQAGKPEEATLAPRASITAPSSLATSPQIMQSAAPFSNAMSNAISLPPAPLGPPKLASERLILSLPTRPASAAANSAAQLAALDPRSNSRRPDMGERMAVALGSDPSLREEIINPGHRRFRQGSTCIYVNDTRDSQLHPFDEKTRGAKLASPCKD